MVSYTVRRNPIYAHILTSTLSCEMHASGLPFMVQYTQFNHYSGAMQVNRSDLTFKVLEWRIYEQAP